LITKHLVIQPPQGGVPNGSPPSRGFASQAGSEVSRQPQRTHNEIFKNILNIYSQYGIINEIDGAVSSVRFAVSEEGPKNP